MKHIISTLVLTLPLAIAAQTPILVNTFPNPTPAAGSSFGTAIAALGSDRLLVGAYGSPSNNPGGVVYLYHTNGTLLTTFTNPTPFYEIGYSITTLGSDRVVIGSSDESVHLFTTNGALVSTLSGPGGPGGQGFGDSIIPFGNDKLLIGATYAVEPGANGIGAAFLYSTNGTLLMTFRNPDTNFQSAYGFCVAAFGNDRVLMSANNNGPGFACLFSTNGTLLTTITNPLPQSDLHFGISAAAVGTDRILVGADTDDPMVSDPARVYVFNTNGALLNTITTYVGSHILVLGENRLVLGAPLAANGTNFQSGAAFVFDIAGAPFATINNPEPTFQDFFGASLAPLGSQGLIIGAPADDAGASNAGSVYLFSIPSPSAPPSVAIQRTTTNTVVVSWPTNATGFVLQQNTNGSKSVNWSNVTAGVQTVGTNQTLIVNPIGGSRFYRLVKP